MRVVVDTNILFSALLNSKGKIGDLLFNSLEIFEFYSVNFLKAEIEVQREKILSISGFTKEEFNERKTLIYGQIKFIDEFLIPKDIILKAEEMAQDVDPDDTLHLALTDHLNAQLWTGDKKLKEGLKRKGFKKLIDTNSLWSTRNKLMNS